MMNAPKLKPYLYNFTIISSLLLIISSCLFAYWPGLDGIFLVDDYPNLAALGNNGGVTNLNSFLSFVFGNHSGPTSRPVSMLSFLLDDQYWPGFANSFKYTNLMIHLLCGMLILALIYRLSLIIVKNEKHAAYLALATSAIWLLHPFNVSTTLYVIQRMTQLATLFTLAGILLYTNGRIVVTKNYRRAFLLMTTGVAICGLLAIFSKENGVLLFVFILVLERTIFQYVEKTKTFEYWFWIFVYAPLGLLFLYVASRGFFVSSYTIRDFTLIERLLTENRILIDYLHSILVPHLSGTGLTNDDVVISRGLFQPVTTVFALIVNIALVIFAIYFRKRIPVFAFSVLWFYGGHLLESTFIPLELYFEHRNYTPMIGPLFGLMYYLSILPKFVDKKLLKYAVVSVPIILVAFSAVLTHKSSKIWGNPGTLFNIWAYEHPDSLRAQRTYGQYLGINNEHELAIETLESTYKKFPYDISLPIAIINIGCRYNISVQYTLGDIESLAKNSRFTDGILPIVKVLVDDIVKGKCAEYTLEDAILLMSIVENIPGIDRQVKTFAKLLFLHSDLHVLNHQLNPAMDLLDRAYQYQKTSTIPLRQAELLVSAGLYKDALKYIEIAKNADSSRKLLVPSEKKLLLNLEKNILHLQKNPSSN